MTNRTFNFGIDGGGEITFGTLEQARLYVTEQINNWNVLGADITDDGYKSNFIANVTNGWNIILQNINNYPQIENHHLIVNVINELINRKLISLGTTKGQTLKIIIEKVGWKGALSVFNQHPNNSVGTTPAEFNASVINSLIELGLKPNSLSLPKSTIEAKLNFLETTQNSYVKSLEQKSIDYDIAISSLTDKFSKIIDDSNDIKNSAHEEFENFKKDSNEQWENIKSAFKEQMTLRASVDYWNKKAEKHRDEYDKWKNSPVMIAIFGFFLIVLLTWMGWCVAGTLLKPFLINTPDVTTAMENNYKTILAFQLAMTGSILLILLTLYVWSIRFSLRMLMTEHHLKIDSSARATMTETYLALIAEGAAGKEDRNIVLATLFKPVTDGLVKDDGMPTISPMSLLVSQMTGTKNSGG